MNKKGVLIVISGFAGSGKGTITKALIEKYDNYNLSVSATTRNPRPGEVDGVDYSFVTREQFEQMIKEGELLEYNEYVGNYYGTPKKFVQDMLEAGKDVILEIDYKGGFNAKKAFPDAVMCFVTPPTAKEVYNRLKGRGTETEEVILKRMKRGREEASVMSEYDFIIINDELTAAVENMHKSIQCAKLFATHNAEFIKELQLEFDEFLKNN